MARKQGRKDPDMTVRKLGILAALAALLGIGVATAHALHCTTYCTPGTNFCTTNCY